MAPRTTGRPANELSVLAVDEDRHHANYVRAVLHQYNFHVIVYTSPSRALNFLKDHAQDVDFLLVALDTKEISGFQFLDMATKMHGNIQVIMMSTTTTMDIMMRCVELGARFLVHKPLYSTAIRNLWQHLDLGDRRMEIIQDFIRGATSTTHGEQSCVTDSSCDTESMKNSNSDEVESSMGSNTVNMGLVNYPDSEHGETVEKGPKGDQDIEVVTSPGN